jgi:hypothetical protein
VTTPGGVRADAAPPFSSQVEENMARHRWEATHNHFYPGPKYWRCIHCDLLKVTEWEEKPEYRARDGRTWHRFAPPCPPPLRESEKSSSKSN